MANFSGLLCRRVAILVCVAALAGGAIFLAVRQGNPPGGPDRPGQEKEDEQGDATRPKGPPCVTVITPYRGMPAEEVEHTITNPVERWVSQADKVRRVRSRSLAGVSVVTVELTADAVPGEALTQVSSLAQATLPNLPPGTLPPVVLPYDPAGLEPVGLVTLGSATRDLAGLTRAADDLVADRLAAAPGVLAPLVLGGTERTVRLRLSPEKLNAYRLSVSDVYRALQEQHLEVQAGQLRGARGQSFVAKAEELKDLRDVVVRVQAGSPIFLRDVAEVTEGQTPRKTLVRVNGRPHVCLPVYAKGEADRAGVSKAVEKALGRAREKLPADVELRCWPLGAGKGGRADGLLTLYLRGPPAMSLDRAEQAVARVERLVEETVPVEERTLIYSEAGVAPDLSAAYTRNAGPQDATLRVWLSAKRSRPAEEYVRRLRPLVAQAIPDLQVSVLAGVVPPLVVRIEGRSLEEALALARDVRKQVGKVRGTADVCVIERMDVPSLSVTVDREKAAALGLTARDVLQGLTDSTRIAPDVWVDGVSSGVRLPGDAVRLREELGKAHITVPGGKPVALESVVRVRETTVPAEINHVGLSRAFHVWVNVSDREVSRVSADIKEVLGRLQVPRGLRVELEGPDEK